MRITPTTRHSKAFLLATLALLASCGSAPEEGERREHPGQASYLRYCFACHQAGVAGAPRFGDREAWAPRIAQGADVLLENVVRGMAPGMPPRGACPACDDETLAAAVDYMVANAQ